MLDYASSTTFDNFSKIGNVKPILSSISDKTTTVGLAVSNIAFSIYDPDASPAAITCAGSVSASSSNTAVLPVANITIGGTAPNCILGLTPVAGAVGTGTVTITLSDTGDSVSTTFSFSAVPGSTPISATGGTVSYLAVASTLYKVHTFASPGASEFIVTNSDGTTPVEYLIVGAGGGGGKPTTWGTAGGGGAVLEGSTTVTAQSYPVSVGAAGVGTIVTSTPGTDGGSSSVFSVTAAGGKGGGTVTITVSGISGSGFAAGTPFNTAAGGGGGAGGVGGNAASGAERADGGIGVASSITGTSIGYGGGGATQGNNGIGTAVDGGGRCCDRTQIAPPNRGGGGAGHWATDFNNGGSGVVIIRYPIGTIN